MARTPTSEKQRNLKETLWDSANRSSTAKYLTYIASVGDDKNSFEVRYEDENIWSTQKTMATLYDVGMPTINYHLKKIFDDLELQEDSVIRKFRIIADDGKRYLSNHYGLQVITGGRELYQKITDLYSTAIGYDKTALSTTRSDVNVAKNISQKRKLLGLVYEL